MYILICFADGGILLTTINISNVWKNKVLKLKKYILYAYLKLFFYVEKHKWNEKKNKQLL